jgi:hypothetical protein
MAMTTGDIVAIERATATMADVMRAVTAGGDAVGIATTIDREAPKATATVERKSPPFRRAFAGAFSARISITALAHEFPQPLSRCVGTSSEAAALMIMPILDLAMR